MGIHLFYFYLQGDDNQSDEEYLDDDDENDDEESQQQRQEATQAPSTLTEAKWLYFGTRSGVEQARNDRYPEQYSRCKFSNDNHDMNSALQSGSILVKSNNQR